MPAWVVPAIIGAASLVSQWLGNRKQKKENRSLAEFQADANEKYLDKQNAYNTPAAQMSRFQDAGLNPHLIYGQGNPGNQSDSLRYPETGRVDYGDMGVAGALQMYNQTALTQSQVAATEAKTRQTGAMEQLNRLQAQVLERNPLLQDSGFAAVMDSLKSSAELKAIDVKRGQVGLFRDDASAQWIVTALEKQVTLLEQRFKLGELDGKIKAEVLNSKEFQNAILEVQKKFMTNAEVTPQHIMQFIQLLLMKIL